MKYYYFSHFTGEDTELGEQVYASVSTDGLHWHDLYDGKPIHACQSYSGGLRDPFMVRNMNGEGFFLLCTDLKIYNGAGWGEAVEHGSKKLLIWKTTDLSNFTELTPYELPFADAGNLWAPEAIWDKKREQYMVFFASNTGDGANRRHRIYCVFTKDFVTFSEPQLYIEKANHVIDTTIIEVGEGYYRFSKDETTKHILMEYATDLLGQWEERYAPGLSDIEGVEGPEIYQLEDGSYCLIIDRYRDHLGYLPLITKDFTSFRVLDDSEFDYGLTKKRHGGVVEVTPTEYMGLLGPELAQELGGGIMVGDLIHPEVSALCRQAAAEGVVLLENNGVLPLKTDNQVAVFGRHAINYFVMGYGSGGDICSPYRHSLMDGLELVGAKYYKPLYDYYKQWCDDPHNAPKKYGWGQWPTTYGEMPLDINAVKDAAGNCDTALVVIGRSAGEDRESVLTGGSFYLTEIEIDMLDKVTSEFSKVVVILDTGNLMDVSFMDRYGDKISALVLGFHGGMETGAGLADVLYGRVNPSGRLTNTIALNYEDYPSAPTFGGEKYNNYAEDIYVGYRYFETFAKDKVKYPFGYGLSYTTFEYEIENFTIDLDNVEVIVKVTNTGLVKGKTPVMCFTSAPQGLLGKPALVLSDFAKTGDIMPGEAESVMLSFDATDMASYDDTGVTGHADCFVIEAGQYHIFAGLNVRDLVHAGTLEVDETVAVKQCNDALGLAKGTSFKRMVNKGGLTYEDVPESSADLRGRILENMPQALSNPGRFIHWSEVKSGSASIEEFVGQFSPQQLEAMTYGDGRMSCPLGVPGNTSIFAAVSDELREKYGIPVMVTTDGPSGIRVLKVSTMLPCGTALASSFNLPMVKQLYKYVGKEVSYYGSAVLLGPGINIQRNPLCGRNFEYFSEDPYLTGWMSVAAIAGIQSQGVSACPKHFACNNQEVNRNKHDSRVSKRALREIYLKGFEISVKEASPRMIMTSYNLINGVYAHYNYDLVTTILRNEWGYEGMITTDWWTQQGESKEFPGLTNTGFRLRAGVDLNMPGSDKFERDGLKTFGQPDGITLGELQACVLRILQFALDA